jgi:hypothetical protein
MDPNRRSFLVKTSAGAAGAVGVAAVGGFAINAAGADSEPALSAAELEAADGPILVEITDPAAGTVQVYAGEQDYSFTDRALVAKVLRATR